MPDESLSSGECAGLILTHPNCMNEKGASNNFKEISDYIYIYIYLYFDTYMYSWYVALRYTLIKIFSASGIFKFYKQYGFPKKKGGNSQLL